MGLHGCFITIWESIMETKKEKMERSAKEARLFANQHPAGRVVFIEIKDPRCKNFFGSMVVEDAAYDRFGVPVVKLEGLSWPVPIMHVRPMPWMVTSYT